VVRLTVYPTTVPRAAVLLAHGAGAGQRHPFIVAAARAFAERGLMTATFEFPYMAEGRRIPDKAAVLEATWRQALAAWREQQGDALALFMAGKSMGGRIASQTAAQSDLGIRGLIFLGYPLHPPGKPAQRRDAHLPSVSAPMLFVQGTRDEFGTADEIRALLPGLTAATLFEVPGGDHSLKVRRGGGVSQEQVMAWVYDAVAGFVAAHV
jgi:predicted alpha/beta-hydrolase family hydrolase